MEHVWNYEGYVGDVRAVDVAVRRLREKVEDNPAVPQFIVTRRAWLLLQRIKLQQGKPQVEFVLPEILHPYGVSVRPGVQGTDDSAAL